MAPLVVASAATLIGLVSVWPGSASEESGSAPSRPVFSLQEVTLVAGGTEERLSSAQVSGWFHVRTRLGFSPGYRSEIEDVGRCPWEYSFCDFALSRHTRSSLSHHASLDLDKDALRSSVEAFAKKVRKDPVDAKFTLQDGKVSAFVISRDGVRLDEDKSVETIVQTLSGRPTEAKPTISLPTVATGPRIRASDAEHLGITELIGEGRTNFAGSPKNRIHNIKRAIEPFNGLLLAPQEEFSFVEALGPVDGEHGYLPELVIKQNRTEPEFGGGICQVSSTVFRAAIYSGLKITARRNHAYPVKYYAPYGMDATIYIPKPDLKFVNNTPGHILMQASIEGTELIFRFYGTSDRRKVEVDGPHILESNPDGSMKTVFTQKVTDTEGETIIDDAFRSNYASPSKYPHPGQEPVLTEKPKDWSERQWKEYRKAHGL
jgi:vancomycin resistance protein YoaR